MENLTIKDRLTPIFRNVFNDDSILVDEQLTAEDVISWDSLTHMLMIAEVESQFSIKFKLREIGNLKNVGSLIDLIRAKANN